VGAKFALDDDVNPDYPGAANDDDHYFQNAAHETVCLPSGTYKPVTCGGEHESEMHWFIRKGNMCVAGGYGTGNPALESCPYFTTVPTPAPTACYNSACGCPGSFAQPWCTEDNAMINSEWCSASAANCASCNGDFCGGSTVEEPAPTPAPVEIEGGCYISGCGCPGSFFASWCTETNSAMRSDWCNESEENCGRCSGTFCTAALD